MNVAEEILRDLDMDGIQFENRACNEILNLYRRLWSDAGVGVEISVNHFTSHSDPEVCNMSVDLLMSDDNYVASEIWSKKDVHVESVEEILAVGVPKAIVLYKSKILDGLAAEWSSKLDDPNLTEEELKAITQRISMLNVARVQMSKKIQRSIL